MWLIIIITYIIGALVTHYIIYKEVNENEIEHQSANIMCVLWPVALLI